MAPSLVATSDAGAGVGYTSMRIRGSDITRINVTLNGIPINDPESQGVWWVDLPDLASALDGVEIQRGIGTSTNGSGAFGASINMQTDKLREKPYTLVHTSYGSFSTLKFSTQFGTGLIKEHWTLDGKISKIISDGYIDRAFTNMNSLYLSGGYYGKKSILRLLAIIGKEKLTNHGMGFHKIRCLRTEHTIIILTIIKQIITGRIIIKPFIHFK